MIIYLIRHGETDWNAQRRIQGREDIPLNAAGRAQASRCGAALRGCGIGAVAVSPLQRAADTARHISEMTGIPARAEPRLTEQNFGKWESTARNGLEFQAAKGEFACRYDGGESMLHLAQRVYNLLDELKARPDRTYLLVAHNGISRMVHSYFYEMTNEEFAAFGVKNCAVLRYDFD